MTHDHAITAGSQLKNCMQNRATLILLHGVLVLPHGGTEQLGFLIHEECVAIVYKST